MKPVYSSAILGVIAMVVVLLEGVSTAQDSASDLLDEGKALMARGEFHSAARVLARARVESWEEAFWVGSMEAAQNLLITKQLIDTCEIVERIHSSVLQAWLGRQPNKELSHELAETTWWVEFFPRDGIRSPIFFKEGQIAVFESNGDRWSCTWTLDGDKLTVYGKRNGNRATWRVKATVYGDKMDGLWHDDEHKDPRLFFATKSK